MRRAAAVAGLATALLAAWAWRASTSKAAATPIRVCSKKFTESVLLGEVVTQLLRGHGVAVVHRAQLGSTRVVWSALIAGECDVYPEYTGTLLADLFADDRAAAADPPRSLAAALAARGVALGGSLGFSDGYALGMAEARAAALGVRTLSDLERHPELRLGLSEEFRQRADGWSGLAARYRLPAMRVRVLDHDLAHRGLAEGALDVIDLYTTDAELARGHIRVLVDDRGYFRDYQAVLLWRLASAESRPELVPLLRRLEGRIDATRMAAANARAKLDHVPEPGVAAALLAELGLGGAEVRESWLRALGRRTLEHLFLVGVSLAGALVISIPLGILAERRPRLGQVVLGVAGALQTIPSLALLVLLIPLVGIGVTPALVALLVYSMLPIVRNTHAGLADIPPSVRESAEALGLPPRARLRLIELPMAARAIVAGVKTAAVIDVGTATLGAIIGAGGYGEPILTGVRLDDVGLILQGALPAAAMALAVQALFDALERLVVPRGLRLPAAT